MNDHRSDRLLLESKLQRFERFAGHDRLFTIELLAEFFYQVRCL